MRRAVIALEILKRSAGTPSTSAPALGVRGGEAAAAAAARPLRWTSWPRYGRFVASTTKSNVNGSAIDSTDAEFAEEAAETVPSTSAPTSSPRSPPSAPPPLGWRPSLYYAYPPALPPWTPSTEISARGAKRKARDAAGTDEGRCAARKPVGGHGAPAAPAARHGAAAAAASAAASASAAAPTAAAAGSASVPVAGSAAAAAAAAAAADADDDRTTSHRAAPG